MLKIKDNVDLKELEKFGFKKIYSNYILECESIGMVTEIIINGSKQNRYNNSGEIFFSKWEINDPALEVLYDLIKADLVEKVEE